MLTYAINRGMSDAMQVNRFGALVRSRRQLLGLTQKDVADAIGRDTSLISQWERGQTGSNLPDPATITRLAKVLACSTEDLLRSAGYLQPEAVRPDPDVDLFTSLVESVEWSGVPDQVKEMIRRDIEVARSLSKKR